MSLGSWLWNLRQRRCKHHFLRRTSNYDPGSYLGQNGYEAVTYQCRCGRELHQIEPHEKSPGGIQWVR